jgi:hypothetical protein
LRLSWWDNGPKPYGDVRAVFNNSWILALYLD